MVKGIDELARQIEAVITINQETRQSMRDSELVLKRALRVLVKTQSAQQALLGMPPVNERPNLRVSMKRFEEARHELRLAVIAQCLDEGMSIGEVSRQYGFSRQLASRLAKEMRERGGDPSAESPNPSTPP